MRRRTMSNLILDASDSPIKRPFDKFWDTPPTRAEVMKIINDLALNDNILSNRADTAHIVVNLLCEKMNITAGELDAYVERKKAEVQALSERIQAEVKAKAEAEAKDAESNS
jgi:hypothetical protein